MSDSKSYRVLNEELEEVIQKLQSEGLDVDEVVKEYQKGINLVETMETYLKSAKNKITKIKPSKLA
jgi:exodeoxyribonuclease VII small subunit